MVERLPSMHRALGSILHHGVSGDEGAHGKAIVIQEKEMELCVGERCNQAAYHIATVTVSVQRTNTIRVEC